MNSDNSNNTVSSNNNARSVAESSASATRAINTNEFIMEREEYEYRRALQLAYAASLVHSISDVPTDAQIEATAYMFKGSEVFRCVICLEDDVPVYKAYIFNCDHMVCCSCARHITSRFCPICRADITAGNPSNRKVELEQLRKDSELARALSNGDEYYNSDADTVIIESDSEDDVVFVKTKVTKSVTTTTTEKRVVQRKNTEKKDRKRSASSDKKPSANKKSRECGSDSDDEWTPV